MTVRSLGRTERVDLDVGTAAVCVMGAGVVAGLAGAAGAGAVLGVSGALVAGAALTLLMAAGLVPPLAMLAVSLPLPAVYGGDVRIAAAAVATAMVLFARALHQVVEPVGAPRRMTLRGPIAALVCAVVLAASFASARGAAIREVLNFGLLLGLLVVATGILAADRRRVRALALSIAAVAGIAGAVAALQSAGALPASFPLTGTSFHRATLGFGWPNELGVFFAVSLPLCWYAVRAAPTLATRRLASAGLVSAGLGLVATFSRGAWLAFILSAGVLLLAGRARLVWRVVFGAVAVVVVIDLLSGGVVTGRLWSLAADPYVVQRAALMLVGVLMFRANPVVGVGPGGFREHLDEYGPGVPWLWDYVGSAHNAYLEMAAETGVIGLVAFLWFLGAHFRVLARGARDAAAAGSEPVGKGSDGESHRPQEDAAGDAALGLALLWSFAAVCLASFTAWPFAHGIGQLVMLVAAMGVVVARQAAGPARVLP